MFSLSFTASKNSIERQVVSTDAILTASAASQLKLANSTVVLNGCETGFALAQCALLLTVQDAVISSLLIPIEVCMAFEGRSL